MLQNGIFSQHDVPQFSINMLQPMPSGEMYQFQLQSRLSTWCLTTDPRSILSFVLTSAHCSMGRWPCWALMFANYFQAFTRACWKSDIPYCRLNSVDFSELSRWAKVFCIANHEVKIDDFYFCQTSFMCRHRQRHKETSHVSYKSSS